MRLGLLVVEKSMAWAVLESCSKVPVWPGLAVWIALFGNLDGRVLAEARFSQSRRLHGHERALTGNGEVRRCVGYRTVPWSERSRAAMGAAGKMVV